MRSLHVDCKISAHCTINASEDVNKVRTAVSNILTDMDEKGLEKDFKKGVKIIDANKVSTKSIKEAIANIAVTDETIFR